jgi:TPR repeat protein
MGGGLPDVRAQIEEMRTLRETRDADALYFAARVAEESIDEGEYGSLGTLTPELADELQVEADEALRIAASLRQPFAAAEVAWRIYHAEQRERAEEAFHLATVASEVPNGQYLLGLFYYTGFGCEVSGPKSLAHHLKAAELGYADAMFELYVYHSRGIGTKPDQEAAVQWCKRAADAGSPRAMANLGGFYATGQGVPLDLEQAVHWYHLAAKNGNGRAAATLGVMYLQGEAVVQDEAAGLEWVREAERLGYDPQALMVQFGLDPAQWLNR